MNCAAAAAIMALAGKTSAQGHHVAAVARAFWPRRSSSNRRWLAHAIVQQPIPKLLSYRFPFQQDLPNPAASQGLRMDHWGMSPPDDPTVAVGKTALARALLRLGHKAIKHKETSHGFRAGD